MRWPPCNASSSTPAGIAKSRASSWAPIVEKAVNTGCDLVCIGSRGMTGLGNALLGSTATKVLHLSKLPVLLVK